MKSNDLKLFALYYIKEHEISDKDKLKLMGFVENANDEEILFLLATGQMPSESNFVVKEIDGQAYRLEKVDFETISKTMANFQAFNPAITAMALSISMKVGKEQMKKLASKCENEKGAAKTTCHKMIRRDAIRAEIRALSSMKTKCHKAKSSETCIKNIDKRIKQLQQRLDTIKVSA
jgi:hypothetical protein